MVTLTRQPEQEATSTLRLGRRLIAGCRVPRIRTMRQFAEDEIVIPDGRYAGARFRVYRQPVAGLLLDEMDSGRWSAFSTTALSQDGKSFLSYVIPTMYHLFELKQTGVCGVTDMGMAAEKWQQDFLPAIEASRYRDLLPRSGSGSRGGKAPDMIKFRNGAALKFMTSAGDDKSRSHFTAAFLALTEVDGMDTARGASREASPVEQMEARVRSYGNAARVYKECTVSIVRGHIWQSIISGSDSRIMLQCPRCLAWVSPEREHFKGWQDAEDELAAAERAHVVCPECAEAWTEEHRVAAIRQCKLLHKGQSIDGSGCIHGDLPRTRTLGFRWHAIHSLLQPLSLVGAEEWKAARALDQDNAEKKLKQFVWAVPIEPDDQEVVSLSVREICERQGPTAQEVVPGWADVLSLGVDCGQYLLHWVLMAGSSTETHRPIQIVDYGIEEVHSRQFAVEQALSMALHQLAGMADDRGWPDEHGVARHPGAVWYDSGWKPVPIYKHCKQAGAHHMPVKGYGMGQYGGKKYNQPKSTGSTVIAIYDGFHLVKLAHNECGAVRLYECDSDRGKARVHDRLGMPMDEAGAILLPKVDRAVEHTSFAKHLLAEQLVEENGVQVWQKTPGHGGHNHWLDASNYALMALLRQMQQTQAAAPVRRQRPRVTGLDGRPYLVTQR